MISIGVLALQGDVREHQRALEDSGVSAPAVRRPVELAAVDALVIPGGESTTIDKLIGIFELREPLAARIEAGMPVYGSCAGMILLASTILDGRADQRPLQAIEMTVRRNAFGRQVDSFEADLAVAGITGEPFRAVFIRAPWVESLGDEVQVLARVTGPDGESHPVAVRQGNALATSFHPEMTGDHRVHGLFAEMVRSHGQS